MNTNKSRNIKIIIALIAVLVFGFYSGMRYAQGNVATAAAARGANFAAGRGVGGAGGVRGGAGGGATAGNIISKDATSITVGLRAGGSKIVFFSPSTSISTVASGTPTDLISGKQVVVQGSANQDGSINAGNIQVR